MVLRTVIEEGLHTAQARRIVQYRLGTAQARLAAQPTRGQLPGLLTPLAPALLALWTDDRRLAVRALPCTGHSVTYTRGPHDTAIDQVRRQLCPVQFVDGMQCSRTTAVQLLFAPGQRLLRDHLTRVARVPIEQLLPGAVRTRAAADDRGVIAEKARRRTMAAGGRLTGDHPVRPGRMV